MNNIERCFVLPDMHDTPGLSKERFELIGKYIAKEQPECVVIIGDFLTFDSCNSHDKNHTKRGQHKPSIIKDLESGKLAMLTLMKPIWDLQAKQRKNKERLYKPKLAVTLGNHEDRFERFINENPNLDGMFETMVLPIFIQAGFEVVPYKKYYHFHDMPYTHTPINGMGKPFGGVNMLRTIATNTLSNMTFGHRHTAGYHVEAKLSPVTNKREALHIICTGSGLPDGYVEDYADASLCFWTSFVTEQTFIDGKFKTPKFISFAELDIMFSNRRKNEKRQVI